MSEQWLGLHNQDDHEWGWGERDAWCTTCEGPRRDRGQCLAKEPCRCCLAAEVEVLRAQVQAVREVSTSRMPATPPGMDTGSYRFGGATLMSQVLTALDGDDE